MNQFFQIPEPCHENWNEMSPTEKGRFCEKCSKEILDLRALGPEIAKNRILLSANPCVRIEENVLSEMNFREWVKSLSLTRQLRWAFIIALVLSFGNALGQSQDTLKQDSLKKDSLSHISINTSLTIFERGEFHELSDSILHNLELPYNDRPWEQTNWEWSFHEILFQGISPDWPTVAYDCPASLGFVVEFIVEPEPAPNEDRLEVNDNQYTFIASKDNLEFSVVAVNHHTVKIWAETDPEDFMHPNPNWRMFFPPISIQAGDSKVKLPIENLQKGRYLIHLSTTRGTRTAKIIL
ncbi:hypothetical protein JYT72_00300 [Crocinitomix catalasitica]|nr:hypothetical protein [Crocinitomix catalasitica]